MKKLNAKKRQRKKVVKFNPKSIMLFSSLIQVIIKKRAAKLEEIELRKKQELNKKLQIKDPKLIESETIRSFF